MPVLRTTYVFPRIHRVFAEKTFHLANPKVEIFLVKVGDFCFFGTFLETIRQQIPLKLPNINMKKEVKIFWVGVVEF